MSMYGDIAYCVHLMTLTRCIRCIAYNWKHNNVFNSAHSPLSENTEYININKATKHLLSILQEKKYS